MKKRILGIFLIVFLFAIISPAGYAAGLSTDASSISVGDEVTVHYAVANRVENVGAITLYINYDNTVLRASSISAETAKLSGGKGQISCVTPREDSSGSIVASWTEPSCSMVLDSEQRLLSITFEVLAETEESPIDSAVIVKGNSSANGIGNDDLSELTGEVNSSLAISTKSTTKADSVSEPTEDENASNDTSATSHDEGKDVSNNDNSINSTFDASAVCMTVGIVLAVLAAILVIAVLLKRRKKK